MASWHDTPAHPENLLHMTLRYPQFKNEQMITYRSRIQLFELVVSQTSGWAVRVVSMGEKRTCCSVSWCFHMFIGKGLK